MGGVLRILQTFPFRFLDLLGLRSTPTAHSDPTVRAAVLCSSTLEDAAGAVDTFPASQVATQAVLRRLVLS